MNAKKHITPLKILVITLSLLMLNNCYQIQDKGKLNNKLIWSDDFETLDLQGWEVIDEVDDEESNWYIEKGFLIQDTDCGNTKSLLGTNIIKKDKEFSDCVMRTNLVCTDDDYIGILFRYNDIDNYYRFLLSSQRKMIHVNKKVKGEFTTLASYTEEEWQYVKFSVTIFLKENNIKVYLNDELFFDVTDGSFAKGKIGFTSISNLGSFFDDVSIYSEYEITPVETQQEIARGPYLQNVLKNHAVIMWDTALPAGSEVEYGISKEKTQSVKVDEEVVKHEVKLENLKQETFYYYRIKSGEVTNEWYSFKTASSNTTAFSFIAYGDTQMNFLRHKEVADQIAEHNFDFIIHAGDVVQRGPRADWDVEFFNPAKNILTSKPVYAAIGNHALNSENYYKNFSNPAAEHENYYSFQYGNCFFVVIDNPRAGYPDREYFTEYAKGSAQYKWLENELASDKAQNAEWLFVVSHIPSYVAGSQDHFSGCKENLVPLFEKYNVDFSFSGHVHGYERGKVNNVNYIITAGGGGALNKKGSSSLKQYKDFKRVYNFCRIDVSGNTISFYAFDKNNEVIDEFSITKGTNDDN